MLPTTTAPSLGDIKVDGFIDEVEFNPEWEVGSDEGGIELHLQVVYPANEEFKEFIREVFGIIGEVATKFIEKSVAEFRSVR